MNMRKTIAFVFKKEGLKGFYRGSIPPLMGSGFYRSIQFSAFEATYACSVITQGLLLFLNCFLSRYTLLDNNAGKSPIPFTNGLEIRVVLGGIMSGTCRALIGRQICFDLI